MLKILHVCNTAGVGSILAKYMDKQFKTQSWVVMIKLGDPFGFTIYGELWNCSVSTFKVKALWKARSYGIVHVHSALGIGRWIKRLYPNKPGVFHYHGSDIRGKWNETERYWRKADVIIVSTPDLLEGSPDGTVYLPTPVDTELFYPKCKHEPKTAFHISYGADDLAKKFAEKYNLKLTIHRREEKLIPYMEFADVLSKYEYYIDVKRSMGKLLKVSSKTALEALACGCKVVCWNGITMQGLPEEHKPENVVKKLYGLYQQFS